MQPFTQKYAIIQLFEDVPEGAQFFWKDWPLHSTLVDVFAIDWDVPTMSRHLTELLTAHSQATSVALTDQFFGPENQTRVVLLKKTESLVKLHLDVVNLLENGGLKPNHPEFIKEGFLPHSTVQKHARLHESDEVTFSALTVIDFFPDGDPHQRKVLKTIQISPE